MAKKTKEEKELADSWGTPQWLFDQLNAKFGFHLDVCADEQSSKCIFYFDRQYSCLDRDWLQVNGLSTKLEAPSYDYIPCFMNPPFSNPRPFIEKAWEQSKKQLVVCLLKVDPSTATWRVFWDHEKHEPRPGCKIEYLPKRVKFVPPPGWKAKDGTTKANGPSFPVAVIIMGRREI